MRPGDQRDVSRSIGETTVGFAMGMLLGLAFWVIVLLVCGLILISS